ncbi:hypothetical protein ACQP2U_42550 (plasmid) [Nocardia sp. CA-084685]|uniref:hypothetical protein n=1 Tax=Nocardia sp. CA-084685 TaxID=3239970 RepID=UPI003D96AA8D
MTLPLDHPVNASSPEAHTLRISAWTLYYGTPATDTTFPDFRRRYFEAVAQAAKALHPDDHDAADQIARDARQQAMAQVPDHIREALLADTEAARALRNSAGLGDRFGIFAHERAWSDACDLAAETDLPAEHLHTGAQAFGRLATQARADACADEHILLEATAAPGMWRTRDGRWLTSKRSEDEGWDLTDTRATGPAAFHGPYPHRPACADRIREVIVEEAIHAIPRQLRLSSRGGPDQRMRPADRVAGPHGYGVVIEYPRSENGWPSSTYTRYDSGSVAPTRSNELRLLEPTAVALPLRYARSDLGLTFTWDGGMQVKISPYEWGRADRFDIREGDLGQVVFVPLTVDALAIECERWLADPDSIIAGHRDFARHPLEVRSWGPSRGFFTYTYSGGDDIEVRVADEHRSARTRHVNTRISLSDHGYNPHDMSYIRVYHMFDDWLIEWASDPEHRALLDSDRGQGMVSFIEPRRVAWRGAIASAVDYLRATPAPVLTATLAEVYTFKHLARDRGALLSVLAEGYNGTAPLFPAYSSARMILTAAAEPLPAKYPIDMSAIERIERQITKAAHFTENTAHPQVDGSRGRLVDVPEAASEATLTVLRSIELAPSLIPEHRMVVRGLRDSLGSGEMHPKLAAAMRQYMPHQMCSAAAYIVHSIDDSTLRAQGVTVDWINQHRTAIHHHATSALLEDPRDLAAAADSNDEATALSAVIPRSTSTLLPAMRHEPITPTTDPAPPATDVATAPSLGV